MLLTVLERCLALTLLVQHLAHFSIVLCIERQNQHEANTADTFPHGSRRSHDYVQIRLMNIMCLCVYNVRIVFCINYDYV